MTARDSHLRRSYGLTEKQYEKMLKSQMGKCALCGSLPMSRSHAVDHEHIKGYKKLEPKEKRKFVRGLLCFRCNKFKVGRLDLEWAKKIYDYLKKYETRNRNASRST